MAFAACALALALLPAFVQSASYTVKVGDTKNVYDPPFLNAIEGDMITFEFHPKNHTVTQSSFDTPCIPIQGGANSGFQPVTNVSALLPTYHWTVAANSSFFFHCQQVGHCGQGMVFAINVDNEMFAEFQAKAIQQNGTASASASVASSTAASAFVTPPPQTWATATATVTHGSSTWTTVYTSYEGTPQPTFAPEPVDHLIKVGADGLSYTPSNISASIGDTVTFEFHPKNHTVTQSSFNDPCSPIATKVGFDSGFMVVSPNTTSGFPTFKFTVNDTEPIWGFCRQTVPVSHCHSGMVFSVNAVESGPNNFSAFQHIADPNGPASASASATISGSGAASPSSSSNGALTGLPVRSAGVLLGVAAAVAALL